jgi:predicted RNA polymerase sigma factor
MTSNGRPTRRQPVEIARAGQFGRYQCLAEIQSVHAQRAVTGSIALAALRTLYNLLLARAPSIGVAVARAAARLAEASGDLRSARQHVERALGLTSAPAVRAFLAARLADLG